MSLSSFGSKKLETVDHVYLASLIYKFLSDNEEDMMIFFEKEMENAIDPVKRNRMLNDNDEKGTIFTRVYLKDVFGFIRHLDKINFNLGYTLTMKRADSGNSIYRTIGNEAKVEIKDSIWYVRHDTPSFDIISLVNEHILSKKNTEYSYVSRMVSYKPVNTNNYWNFEIGVESGTDIPTYVIVGFQTTVRVRPDQTQNNAIFGRPDMIEASCIVGTTRYPDNEFQVDFLRNKYFEPYNEIRDFIKITSKVKVLLI